MKINIGNDRVYGLDIIRCLAILFVMIEHGNNFLPDSVCFYTDYFVLDGVSVFFVLSGFLIGGILIKEFEKKDISLKVIMNFWQRRWFRTLPNYFLILIILSILELVFTNNFAFNTIVGFFIFSQNLFGPHPLIFFPEAWSLSIEEWFYLLIPLIALVLFVFKLPKRKAIIYTAFSILLAITLFRIYRYINISISDYHEWDIFYRKQVFTRLDSLMYGVIGSYILFFYKSIWIKYKIPLFFFGVILLVFPKFLTNIKYESLYFCVFSLSVNSVGTLFLLPYLSDIKKGNGLIFNVVTYISLISYSMYLINLSIVQKWILGNINFTNLNIIYTGIIKYFLFWIITIILSLIIYKYYETSMTKLRDKIG